MKQATRLRALLTATTLGFGFGLPAGLGLIAATASPAMASPAAASGLLAPAVAAPLAPGGGLSQAVSVGGTVTTPASYSAGQLATLPQTTFTVPARGGSATHADQGVSVEQLVQSAVPVLPAGVKNGLLRVLVTVVPFAGLPETFAVGELDPSFGDHPAYLVLRQDGRAPLLGPQLVVPGDTNDSRTVYGVRQLIVAVVNAPATTPAQPGDLRIEAGLFTTVLSAAQLAALPAETLDVRFAAGSSPQTHTETGPTLDEVLAAAHIPPEIVSWVAGVGSDDYIATVTPAEAHVGGRPLLISTDEDGVPLEQPRLVTDGDVKGGRYDSDLVDLVVGFPSYLSFLDSAQPPPS
ncbi:MAG TPA: hypothetical protein VG165_07890 [Solirubrobacteraceae bacterium]|jgi:hypothetical protein|nr:hypothetical protein [Solirubrobacteraceae bacterium]